MSEKKDLDALRADADRLVPGFGRYVESESKITFDTRDRCLRLFSPLSVEEIEAAIHSENDLFSWLRNCDRLFDEGEYTTVITAFYTVPETVEKVVSEIGKDAAHYKAKTGERLTLSRYLSRAGAKESPLERAITRTTEELSLHIFPSQPLAVAKDPYNLNLWSLDPTKYGTEQFFPTGKNGEVGVGVSLRGMFTKEYLGKVHDKVFARLTVFDEEVHDACDRLHSAGNRYVTIPMIYREMRGNRLGPTMKKKIIDSLDGMDAFRLRLHNEAEIDSEYDYKEIKYHGALLPNKIYEREGGVIVDGKIVTVNGKRAETLVDLGDDPFPLSNDFLQRKQYQQIPEELYHLPGKKRNLDFRTIAIRRFLINKIYWKDFKGRIAWSEVYKAADATKSRELQRRCRELVKEFLERWKSIRDPKTGAAAVIVSYEITERKATFTIERSKLIFKNS